jgi:phosphatidylinositol alpha 1,6-mannosyltransferase
MVLCQVTTPPRTPRELRAPARFVPRVAFFADSYYEANGVARTALALQTYAAERGLPMLVVHGGRDTRIIKTGSIVRLELRRSNTTSFPLDHDLRFDLALWRHSPLVARTLDAFEPDVLHFTGPSDVGQIGAWLGYRQRIPMVGSWHTNLHEYAARRLSKRIRHPRFLQCIEAWSLEITLLFYRIPRVVLAPNGDWQVLLKHRTGKPTEVMTRGIDTSVFTPTHRTKSDDAVNVGYVGRLSTEKNITLLPELERALIEGGYDYRFTIVGDGTDAAWLRQRMRRAEFTGVLRGDALASAYANMDVFAFPSETETVGNVVLEAMASGVPVVAMARGGHRFITQAGRSALIAKDREEFIVHALALAADSTRRAAMSADARADARERSWDAVFDGVYQSYVEAIARPRRLRDREALAGRTAAASTR